MFAPPPIVEARTFASLPPEFRVTENPDIRFGHARDSFLEGPAFDRAGNLYCSDIPYGRIFRVSPEGRFELAFRYDGRPNGLAFHSDGRLFIADQRKGLLALDLERGRIETILDSGFAEPFRGLNDLIFAKNGDLYFSDQGQSGLQKPNGGLYRLSAEGRLDRLLDNIPSPNGMALSGDDSTLYLAVTRANAVWRIPLAHFENGSPTRVGIYLQLSGGTGPDGVAMGADGSLAVTHIGLGTVWFFDRLGEPVLRIRSPEGLSTTSVAFGGPEGRTLFITESATGRILCAEAPVAGEKLFSHS